MKKFWIALTAAYFALLPKFYLSFSANNRYDMQWSLADHFAVIVSVLVLGLVFLALYELARMLSVTLRMFPPRILAGLTVAALIGILMRTTISLLDRSGHLATPAGQWLISPAFKLGCAAVIFVAALLFPKRLSGLTVAVFTILTSAMGLGLLVPFTYVSRGAQNLPPQLPSAPSAQSDLSAHPNVYIFIFDEWSYERTFPGGTIREDMPALAEFARTATVYHNAYSPAKYTWVSVPKFLLQTDPAFLAQPDKEIMDRLFSETLPKGRTIFAEATNTHFRMIMGFAMNYKEFLGHQTDIALRVHHGEESPGFAGGVRILLASQLASLRFVGVNVEKYFRFQRLPKTEVAARALEETHRLTKTVIRNVNKPTFLVAHYELPHVPSMWDRDGRRTKTAPNPYLDFSLEGYTKNLMYLDTVIADLVSTLKSAGKWDNSMIMLISDHSWRTDPDGPMAGSEEVRMAHLDRWAEAIKHEADPLHPWKHVPLLIKMPGQNEPRTISDTTFTIDTYPLIHAALFPSSAASRPDQAPGGE